MKVLILTAKFGMGHLSASNSIKQDLLKFDRTADVKVMDFYEYSMPVLSKYIYSGFNMMIKYAKPLYKLYYSENDKETTGADLLTRKLASSCKTLFEEERPDVVISTFPIISKAVGYYKEVTGSGVSLVTCITDVSSHYEWITANTDKYMVPCVEVKEGLMKKGIDAEKIVVYGIPVSDRFKENYMKLASQKAPEKHSKIIDFSAYRAKKELLIMGGGLGVLPSNQEFYRKLNEVDNVHTTIVAGRNQELYNMIHDRYENITVLGYTDRVSELMEKADCVVTKPGGITMFEAIYSLTPIISFATDLPNELNNINFIEDNNFGIVLNDSAENSIDRIVKFVNSTKRINVMKESMKNFVSGLEAGYFANYAVELKSSENAGVKVNNL